MKLLALFTRISLFLWIFSIPLSLAYHWNIESANVHGVLVDYRIPTLALSSIFLLLFILLVCIRKIKHANIQELQLGKTVVTTVIWILLFQCVFALFQFRFQQSLTGYLPFGEVSFSSPQIAKSTFFSGYIYKLPYGTTIHPNVLAGFLVVSFLLLLIQRSVRIDRKYMVIFFLLASFLCFLTQSFSASLALVGGCLLFFYQRKGRTVHLLLSLAIICIPVLSMILFSLSSIAQNMNASLSRRSQLQSIAFHMIATHPLTGVGWNNFTLQQESYGYVTSTVRFLQPVHNAFLLLVTELGVCGWIFCAGILLCVRRMKKQFIPVAFAIIFISSFDHYFLTLTTGRMLLLLCLFYYFLPETKQE